MARGNLRSETQARCLGTRCGARAPALFQGAGTVTIQTCLERPERPKEQVNLAPSAESPAGEEEEEEEAS